MKKILKNNAKTKKYLESLPKIYMVACWAGYGVREFYYAGKCTKEGMPYVYDYDDHNGLADQYELRKLTNTTTGWIYAWTTSKSRAEDLAKYANIAVGRINNDN